MPSVRGLSYPLTVVSGTLALATDADLIRGHILSVLETEPLERVMRPEYGTPDFLFQGITDINLVAQFVRQALEREILGPEFGVTGTLNDEGVGVLTVQWAIQNIPQPPLQFTLAN